MIPAGFFEASEERESQFDPNRDPDHTGTDGGIGAEGAEKQLLP